MSLGCDDLTDDQLLDLLQEACTELAGREHYVRAAAQRAIDIQAENLTRTRLSIEEKERALREAIDDAVVIAKTEFVRQLNSEVVSLVRHEVAAGRLKLFDGKQEAAMIVDADAAAKKIVLGEIKAKLREAKRSLTIQFTGTQVTVAFGTQSFASRCYYNDRQVEEIVRDLARIVGADCPP